MFRCPRSMRVTRFLHAQRRIPDAATQAWSPVPVLCSLTRSEGWPGRREVAWRKDGLEQAELTASSLVGGEKLQMVLRAGHKLRSHWPCLSAGFSWVLLSGPDGDCRASNLLNNSLIFARSSHTSIIASTRFPAGFCFYTSVQ